MGLLKFIFSFIFSIFKTVAWEVTPSISMRSVAARLFAAGIGSSVGGTYSFWYTRDRNPAIPLAGAVVGGTLPYSLLAIPMVAAFVVKCS